MPSTVSIDVMSARVRIATRLRETSELTLRGRLSESVRATDEEGNDLTGYGVEVSIFRVESVSPSAPNIGSLSVDPKLRAIVLRASVSAASFDQYLALLGRGRTVIHAILGAGIKMEKGAYVWELHTLGAQAIVIALDIEVHFD